MDKFLETQIWLTLNYTYKLEHLNEMDKNTNLTKH